MGTWSVDVGAGRTFALTAAAALLCSGAVCSAALGQAAPVRLGPDARTMIMGPLLEELQPQSFQLYTDTQIFDVPDISVGYVDLESLRPNASRLARFGLLGSGDAAQGASLAAFSETSSTLISSPTGGRLSISLFDGGQSDALLSSLTTPYVEAGGSVLTGFDSTPARNMALRYETRFDAMGQAQGLDFGLAPRAGVSLGTTGPAYEAGATLRLGQYVRQEADGRPAWWLFAGADRQAVLYDPRDRFRLRDGVVMQPYAIVGDAQAGVAVRVGGADLSIAYIHRETEFSMPNNSWETQEGFAAFSLTVRH